MPSDVPQFSTAEYQTASGGETCKSCKQPIKGHYYRVNGMLACERCVEQLKNQIPKDSHSAYVRGLIFGIGGALIGLGLYSAFAILTGIVIGYVSLAVGWIIAKAIRMGSGGMGGRRYQVAAALLTYMAVSMAAIPIYVSEAMKAKSQDPPHTQTTPTARSNSAQTGQSAEGTSDTAADQASTKQSKMGLGSALGLMVLLGLASPFLELQDPFHGGIGLVILFVGINIAWRMTAGPKLDILGPFTASAPAAPSATV